MLLDQELSSEEHKLSDQQLVHQSIERLHNLAMLLQGFLLLSMLVILGLILKNIADVVGMLLLFILVEVIFIYISSMVLGFFINFIPYKGVGFMTRFPRSAWIGMIIIHILAIGTCLTFGKACYELMMA